MIRNIFEKGPEGWCSYDYHASMVDQGTNIFVLTTWARTGGVNNTGCVWSDNTRWSADTPERPLSILPLIFYRNWVNADPIEIKDAGLSVYLRGDQLNLDGGHCLFWVYGHGTRWHMNTQPLTITEGGWASEPNQFELTNDQSLWHMSWSGSPDNPAELNTVLSRTHSYGFSFVGFTAEVTGRLSMAEFMITR